MERTSCLMESTSQGTSSNPNKTAITTPGEGFVLRPVSLCARHVVFLGGASPLRAVMTGTARLAWIPTNPYSVAQVLSQEGFARLPRRRDDERPPGTRPTVADVADVRALNLKPR